MLRNVPPTRYCPFGSVVVAKTVPASSGAIVESGTPYEFTRARYIRGVGVDLSKGWKLVKYPPRMTLPSV